MSESDTNPATASSATGPTSGLGTEPAAQRSTDTAIETPGGTVSISFTPENPKFRPAVPVRAWPPSRLRPSCSTPAPAARARSNVNANEGTSGTFFDQLKGIPIDYLIASPLIASARANMALAEVMTEFVAELGFEDDGKTTRIIEFELTREIQDPSTKKFEPPTITVQAPLLALVPLPALLI